jgi:hypothetical protein
MPLIPLDFTLLFSNVKGFLKYNGRMPYAVRTMAYYGCYLRFLSSKFLAGKERNRQSNLMRYCP